MHPTCWRVIMSAIALGLVMVIPHSVALAAGGGTELPVVGCKTELAAGSGIPVIPGYLPSEAAAPSHLSTALRSQLAWYEGDTRNERDLKLLGPRGFDCFALLATDGGWSLTVVPRGVKPTQEVEIGSSYNGPGASVACDFFPDAYKNSPLPDECKAPLTAAITLRSSHLVTVATEPAGSISLTNGFGQFITIRSPLTELSFLYWYPTLNNTAEGVQCLLPASKRPLCQAILAEAQARVGGELAAGHH